LDLECKTHWSLSVVQGEGTKDGEYTYRQGWMMGIVGEKRRGKKTDGYCHESDVPPLLFLYFHTSNSPCAYGHTPQTSNPVYYFKSLLYFRTKYHPGPDVSVPTLHPSDDFDWPATPPSLRTRAYDPRPPLSAVPSQTPPTHQSIARLMPSASLKAAGSILAGDDERVSSSMGTERDVASNGSTNGTVS
jgi:hypothetical protein